MQVALLTCHTLLIVLVRLMPVMLKDRDFNLKSVIVKDLWLSEPSFVKSYLQ